MGCGSSAPAQPDPAPAPAPAARAAAQEEKKDDMKILAIRVPPGARPGQLIQVPTPYGSLVQCQIPQGLPPGGVFQVQYMVPKKKVGQAVMVDEEDKFNNNNPVEAIEFPSYWTNVKYPNNSSFDQMVYVDKAQHPKFDELLEKTYVSKATQDRKCPKISPSVPCARTPGGCACVRPDGFPGLPTGYRVRRVIRVEDSEMWYRYHQKRSVIKATRTSNEIALRFDPAVKTDEIADKHPEVFDPLDNELNEVYLWHGTNVRTALSIAQDDFKVDLAGSNVGTMYGRGAYLAESSTKADEYASDEPGGYYDGVFAILLCRTVMGKFFLTTERDESAGDKVATGEFDSTLGDRVKSVGTFREFVVYDGDQLYPEYVVLYTRVDKSADAAEVNALANTPYHMQLPVYWTNCHRDPGKEVFHLQCKVRQSTREILQRLLSASYTVEGRKIELVGARRVENSVIWEKYVQFKTMLKAKLHGSQKSLTSNSSAYKAFVQANELDGNPESGSVLTHDILGNEAMEESISISNLETHLNEFLLWHGTSMDAAEKIVQTDFQIPKDNDASSGCRFGYGAYFAEHLGKSLNYAKPETDGTQYVLLCRILCGDIYYTEAESELDAGKSRQISGKHSVLANPSKGQDREFIVQNADQVYPEYILEVKVTDLQGNRISNNDLVPVVLPPAGHMFIDCGAPACKKRFSVPKGSPAAICPHCKATNQFQAQVGCGACQKQFAVPKGSLAGICPHCQAQNKLSGTE